MASSAAPVAIVDAILVLVAIETVVLLLLWRWRRIGIAPHRLVPMLAAGACLLLALRAVLAGQSWHMSALWLGLSFIAHLVDVAARWRRRDAASTQAAAHGAPIPEGSDPRNR